jgi:hypothetical protein
MKRTFGTVALLAALVFGQARTSFAEFTFPEKNLEALDEGVILTVDDIVQGFGAKAATLSFTGSFTSMGWNATLTGNYGGNAVNITYSGTLSAAGDTGSFTSSGTVGPGTWAGTGNWAFNPPAGNPTNMTWDSSSTYTVGANPLIWDKHFLPPGKLWSKSTLPSGDTHIVDSGTYIWTLFGVPIPLPQRQEISDWIIPAGNPGGATVTVSLPTDSIRLTSTADFTAGTTSGTVTVPEPSAFVLMCTAIPLVIAYCCRTR